MPLADQGMTFDQLISQEPLDIKDGSSDSTTLFQFIF